MKTYEANADYLEYTGSEQTYMHPFWKIAYSEGVRALLQGAGCYWLLDQIAPKMHPETARQALEGLLPDFEFQAIKLRMVDDSSAVITIEDGNDRALVTIPVPFTDFDYQGGLRLFAAPTQVQYQGAIHTTYMVYLPSEH